MGPSADLTILLGSHASLKASHAFVSLLFLFPTRRVSSGRGWDLSVLFLVRPLRLEQWQRQIYTS